ncbi:signal recognition particle protein [candidate division WOR-3 bacterium]|uniref:signal-recognition-particle GTPase n=1 Tax=candidate division WOR-3 bacterium TaxID=2052148 RepID=A0A9D5QET2_UNCW3|nr:signal recognition particle protein [candidate division WOR-3 bacterium]MBD3365325.1 signal recognition particle protein [candidate division WOR-3 bacterium]
MFDLLKDAFTKLKRELVGRGSLSEKEIKDFLRTLRLTLLEADVNYKAAKTFVATLEEKLSTTEIYNSLTPGKQALKVIYEELTDFLGGKAERLHFEKPPAVILLLGLQGVGKTTHAGKLARMYHGKRPLLVAADVKRPAAVEQLESVAKRADSAFFGPQSAKAKNLDTCKSALKYANQHSHELVIIDSAGRLHIDDEMVNELVEIKGKIEPDYSLLVLDGLVGQDALNQTEEFHARIGVSGGILTKLDGDSRGGAAISFRHVTGLPIYFIGTGERLEDLEVFHPDRIAARILGEGDITTVAEQVREVVDERQSAEMAQKLMEGRLNFDDLLSQMKQLSKMGDLSKILDKMPAGVMGGMSAADFDPSELKRTEAIILSMTPEERENPVILDGSRKLRIARGSGTTPADVNQLIKQLDQMQQMSKLAKSGGVPQGMPGAGRRFSHGGKKKKRKKGKKRRR